MEGYKTPKEREAEIDRLIENLAEREKAEGFGLDEIKFDIITFALLSEEDVGAEGYFEELAEKIGISKEEMVQYAIKKAQEYTEE